MIYSVIDAMPTALTLAELVAATGFLMTEFLTLHRTGVTLEHTGCLEQGAEFRV